MEAHKEQHCCFLAMRINIIGNFSDFEYES